MAPSANVIIEADKALLVDPDGNPVSVNQAEVSGLLAEGYRPETFKEFDNRNSVQWGESGGMSYHGDIEMPDLPGEDPSILGSLALGAGSAATFGGSDLAARAGGMSKEELARYEEENPIAYGLGYAGGLIGPALATGGGSLLARLGIGAGKGLAKAASKAPISMLGKAAASAGAKVGGKAGKVAGAGVAGAIEGGAMGAGEMLHQAALTDEVDPTNILLGTVVGGGLGAGFEGLAGVLRAGGKYAKGGSKTAKGALEEAAEGYTGGYTTTSTATSAAKEAAKRAGVKAGDVTSPDLLSQLMGYIGGPKRLMGAAGAGLVFGPTTALAMMGAKPLMRVLPHAAKATEKIGRSAAMRAGVPAMSVKAYNAFQDRLTDEGLQAYEQQVLGDETQRAIAFGVSPEAAQQAAQLKMESMRFLKEKSPPAHQPPPGDVRSLIKPRRQTTPGDRLRFARYVRTVEDPGSLVSDFRGGALYPEAVEVWERLYPGALEEFREMVRQAIGAVGNLDTPQIRQANRLMGQPVDVQYVQMIQQNHAGAEKEQQGGIASSGDSIATAYQTPVQGLGA